MVGPNGAGKTTIFYMITGLVEADDEPVTDKRRRRDPLEGSDVLETRRRLGVRRAHRAREREHRGNGNGKIAELVIAQQRKRDGSK